MSTSARCWWRSRMTEGWASLSPCRKSLWPVYCSLRCLFLSYGFRCCLSLLSQAMESQIRQQRCVVCVCVCGVCVRAVCQYHDYFSIGLCYGFTGYIRAIVQHSNNCVWPIDNRLPICVPHFPGPQWIHCNISTLGTSHISSLLLLSWELMLWYCHSYYCYYYWCWLLIKWDVIDVVLLLIPQVISSDDLVMIIITITITITIIILMGFLYWYCRVFKVRCCHTHPNQSGPFRPLHAMLSSNTCIEVTRSLSMPRLRLRVLLLLARQLLWEAMSTGLSLRVS